MRISQTAHVEKLMRTLTEQTAARRGIIGRSLTSGVKKWLQSSQTPANQPQANIRLAKFFYHSQIVSRKPPIVFIFL